MPGGGLKPLKTGDQRTAVAAEYVSVFAEAAKQRQIEGGRAGAELTNSTSARVKENFPEPEKPRPQATDEAAELFGVSGRSVRDWPIPAGNSPVKPTKGTSGNPGTIMAYVQVVLIHGAAWY